MESTENSKDKRLGKIKTFIVIVIIAIPILVTSLLYFNNMTFRTNANKQLAKLPGAMGEYFKYSPTESERNEKKAYLANYYLSLDLEIAADKLYIIKKDDEKLYSEIIRLMNIDSKSKTEGIVGLVRNLELRKDLLFSIYDEIQMEKKDEIFDEVYRLENQDLLATIKEIESRVETDNEFKQRLPELIGVMDEDRTTSLLYYIDEDTKEKIFHQLPDYKRLIVEKKLAELKAMQIKLEDLAYLYETKPVESVLKEIGNTENYSIDELAQIYRNLSVIKAGEILSRIDDDTFIEDVFISIRDEELLIGDGTTKANDISNSIQFFKEYNNRIDELVKVYERVDPAKTARIAERLLKNDTTVTALEVESKPVFQISDASIIVDVLSRMKNKVVTDIFNNMKEETVSEITQILALPYSPINKSIIPQKPDELTVANNKGIDALTIVYENMKPDLAARIIVDMVGNSTTSHVAYEILSEMNERRLSEILNNMEADEVSEITGVLAR